MTVQRRRQQEYWNLRNSRLFGISEIHVPALQPRTCCTIKETLILASFLWCKRWWILNSLERSWKQMGFAFAGVQDNSVAWDFFIINVWRAVTAVCVHVGVLSPPSARMVSGCFHEEDTYAELWSDATSVPFCLFLGNANWSPCARMWWDQTAGGCFSARPHTAPNLLFFLLLQDVPYVCFIPRCSCPLFSIK